MKKLILVTTILFSAYAMAQPAKTTSSSSSSYSIEIDDDDDITQSSSISVTKSDDSYKFRASFHNSKTEKIKKAILDKLGKENLTVKGNTYQWNKYNDGDEVFECKLTKGRVRMYLNKDDVSNGFYNKIDDLGQEIKYLISGKSPNVRIQNNADRAKRELERAQRDLERAKRELERAEREAKRAKKN